MPQNDEYQHDFEPEIKLFVILFFLMQGKKISKIEDKIILGIDPGTTVMGYGIVHVKNNKLSMINMGVIRLNKIPDHPTKLKRIFDRVDELIESYKPDEMAIEAPFFGKNVQSMLKLGRAQGVAMAAGLNFKIPITEYSPKKIKLSITGNGNAHKSQIQFMVKAKLNMNHNPEPMDAADALAIALCHNHQFCMEDL